MKEKFKNLSAPVGIVLSIVAVILFTGLLLGLGFVLGKIPGLNEQNDYLLQAIACLLYTSPSPRDRIRSRMPSSA